MKKLINFLKMYYHAENNKEFFPAVFSDILQTIFLLEEVVFLPQCLEDYIIEYF